MRYAVLGIAAVILVPVMVAGGAVAVTALLGEWFDFQLLDFSNIGVLDWLAAGPGASANSFENYVTFVAGGVPVGVGGGVIWLIWQWARANRGGGSDRSV